MTKTSRVRIPSVVRTYVLDRDNSQCRSCGKTDLVASLQIDHIIPLAQGGSNDISNLQTLCSTCNQRKKHHTDTRFRRNYDL